MFPNPGGGVLRVGLHSIHPRLFFPCELPEEDMATDGTGITYIVTGQCGCDADGGMLSQAE
jgi:hypothetical protein